MNIKFNISESLKKKLTLDKKQMAQNMERAMNDEKAIIDSRTEQGKDVDGKTFVEYSKPYKKIREFGRKGKNPQTGGKRVHPPNLTVSGKMLSAMQVDKVIIKGSLLIGRIMFTNQSARDKALGNNKKRKFFALSNEQERRIKQRITGDK